MILLCVRVLGETELIYVYICKGIYCKDLAYVIMEDGKSKIYRADVPVQVPRLAGWKKLIFQFEDHEVGEFSFTQPTIYSM